MKTLTVKIPEELDRKLSSVARQLNRSRSELLRGALSSYLEKPEVSENISALDLAGQLVGCIDGPEDLSTNETYLSDYGE
ncbi:MAG: ribbon-helix-helix domain-containing protein [Pseudomonadota bacterium]